MAGIDQLKAIIGKRDIAKSNRFEVDFSGLNKISSKLGISGNDLRDLTPLVDSVNMPGRQLQTFGYDLFRHMTEFPTGYVNEAFSVEFLSTADFHPKRIFDKWIDYVVPTSTYLIKYADEYKCDITIKQKTLSDDTGYKLILDDVFPKAIRGITYSNDADDVVKFGVEFAFNDISIADPQGNVSKLDIGKFFTPRDSSYGAGNPNDLVRGLSDAFGFSNRFYDGASPGLDNILTNIFPSYEGSFLDQLF